MKRTYSKPLMAIEVFEPHQFIAACDPEHMYTITPADTSGIPDTHMYILGERCTEQQGPVEPNQTAITVSADAMPTVMELIHGANAMLWEIGYNEHGHQYHAVSGYQYNVIATSSNSFGGHITGANVGTFHAYTCTSHDSQNAIFVFNAADDIHKNMS